MVGPKRAKVTNTSTSHRCSSVLGELDEEMFGCEVVHRGHEVSCLD